MSIPLSFRLYHLPNYHSVDKSAWSWIPHTWQSNLESSAAYEIFSRCRMLWPFTSGTWGRSLLMFLLSVAWDCNTWGPGYRDKRCTWTKVMLKIVNPLSYGSDKLNSVAWKYRRTDKRTNTEPNKWWLCQSQRSRFNNNHISFKWLFKWKSENLN